jgi:hypothetical protein
MSSALDSMVKAPRGIGRAELRAERLEVPDVHSALKIFELFPKGPRKSRMPETLGPASSWLSSSKTRQITWFHLGRPAFRLLSVAFLISVETGLNGTLRIGL